MKFATHFLLVAALAVAQVYSNDCGDGQIRGVNLGGLFLLEPWITPTIFEEVNVGDIKDMVVDEYTYAQYVDKEFAKERLERHWNEFYSKADFEVLFNAGISHLRVPFGYWLVDVSEDEPFPPPPASDEEGMRKFLLRTVQWAEEVGLKVLLDLHGAPGSQNGFDNSGKRGEIRWHKDGNPERTIVILGKVADLIKSWLDAGKVQPGTIAGLELMNEPWGIYPDLWEILRDSWHYEAYDKIRNVFPNPADLTITVQQAFRGYADWHDYMPAPMYENVLLDYHEYQCFGSYWNDLADQPEGWLTHLEGSCNHGTDVETSTLTTVTGEFSLAVTDCQKYLNGGYADPYIPPDASEEACAYYNSNPDTYSDEYKAFLKDYFIAQIDGYEKGETGNGWFFWTAKTENTCAPEWDFLWLLENGLVPSNLCERPTYCQF